MQLGSTLKTVRFQMLSLLLKFENFPQNVRSKLYRGKYFRKYLKLMSGPTQ